MQGIILEMQIQLDEKDTIIQGLMRERDMVEQHNRVGVEGWRVGGWRLVQVRRYT